MANTTDNDTIIHDSASAATTEHDDDGTDNGDSASEQSESSYGEDDDVDSDDPDYDPSDDEDENDDLDDEDESGDDDVDMDDDDSVDEVSDDEEDYDDIDDMSRFGNGGAGMIVIQVGAPMQGGMGRRGGVKRGGNIPKPLTKKRKLERGGSVGGGCSSIGGVGSVSKVSNGGAKTKPKPINPELKDYTEDERKYYETLSNEQRMEVDQLERRLCDINDNGGFNGTNVPRRFRLLQSPMDERSKAIVFQKLYHLDRLSQNDNEYHKLTTWMDGIAKIPFGKYKALPVNSASPKEDICAMLRKTKEHLDTRVYGHHEVKDHIVRILAQWISNPTGKGMVIGIHGAPGVGKTVLVKDGICNSLGLPFSFIPLGGMADRSEFIGHSYTYEGARWGKIAAELMKASYMNPVLFFDELDKVSGTKHGEEIINLLMQITDPSQNDKFHDSYFSDFEFDLSRCIVIFSYNDESMVNPILRDRMIRIETAGYKVQDKLCIAKAHLIPEMLREFNMDAGSIIFNDDTLRAIIDTVEEEQGVRNFKRAIHDIISNLHLNILIGDLPNEPIPITKEHVAKYVHKKKHNDNMSMNMIYL